MAVSCQHVLERSFSTLFAADMPEIATMRNIMVVMVLAAVVTMQLVLTGCATSEETPETPSFAGLTEESVQIGTAAQAGENLILEAALELTGWHGSSDGVTARHCSVRIRQFTPMPGCLSGLPFFHESTSLMPFAPFQIRTTIHLPLVTVAIKSSTSLLFIRVSTLPDECDMDWYC